MTDNYTQNRPADHMLYETVEDGKYTVIQHRTGNVEARRYGETWRDCTGDGLILALGYEVERLRGCLAKLEGIAHEVRNGESA